jgi:glycolate oxidase FAD binding subunit
MSAAAPRIAPRTADELCDLMQQAVAERAALSVCGGGTRRALYASADRRVLDMSGLSGITQYQPEELVLSLRAGTPLDYVESVLAEQRQMLAFEPPHLAAALGTQPARKRSPRPDTASKPSR